MSPRVTIDVPLNRVEGDLEVRAELDGDTVQAAYCAGTMFRGIERLLMGRDAMDGLVITPRVCGICSLSHLTAAVRALDALASTPPPPNAQRVRHVALMAEHVQSDMRQVFLYFAADFANGAHAGLPGHHEAVRRYAPVRGETALETIRATKDLLGIPALLGGQWPHASFMVPGGIASTPGPAELLQCRLLLRQFRCWYERRVLGCALERMGQVRSGDAFDAWLDEAAAHRDGDLGMVAHLCRAAGLHHAGRGPGRFLSYGAFDLPEGTTVGGAAGGTRLVPDGVTDGTRVEPFDAAEVREDVSAAFYEDGDGPVHPFEGTTNPYATGAEGRRYSWAKAPRYRGQPAETGPLAEALLAGQPLLVDLVRRDGPSAFARVLARLLRPARLLPAMETWLDEIDPAEPFYRPPGPVPDGAAAGLVQAARGALGHWMVVQGGLITRYQIVTPTGWNASPRDGAGIPGPLEQALVGTRVKDVENPVELGHVVRSFDPCLVCTVHTVRDGRRVGRTRVGDGR